VTKTKEQLHILIDYILSSGNPGIEPIYYKIAIGIVILLAFVTGYHCRRGRISKSQSVAVILLVTYILFLFLHLLSFPDQNKITIVMN
jgi:purine-cytosine permease-like protein